MVEIVGILSGLALLGVCFRQGALGAVALVCYAIYLPVPVFASSLNKIGIPNVSVELATGLLFVGCGFAYWQHNLRPPISRSSLVFVAGFAIVAPLTSWGRGLDGTNVAASLAWPLIWLAGILVGSCARSRPQILLATGVAVLPSAALALYGIRAQNNLWLDKFGVAQFNDVIFASSGFRSTGTMVHPSVAGCVFAILAIVVSGTRARFSGVVGLILVLASAATVTRSALIGLVIAGAISLVWSNRRPSSGSRIRRGGSGAGRAVVVMTAVLVAVKLTSLSDIYRERVLGGTGDQSVREAGYRYLLNRLAHEPFSLIFGGGFGHERWVASQQGGVLAFYQTFDNQMITWILDAGFVSLLPGLAGLLVAMVGTNSGRRAAPAIAAGLVMMQFGNLMQFIPFGFVFGMVIGMLPPSRAVQDRSEERREAVGVFDAGDTFPSTEADLVS